MKEFCGSYSLVDTLRSQSLACCSLPRLGRVFQPTPWRQAGLTVVVGADLQRSVSPHQDADGALLLVFEQLDVAGAPLLPLGWVVL